MTDFNNLSETEIQALIENAEKALREKQSSKRKEVIAKMKELAASINVGVEIIDLDKKNDRKTGKVPAKYRNPENPAQTWTGRGLAPKWMQDLTAQGYDKSSFEIN